MGADVRFTEPAAAQLAQSAPTQALVSSVKHLQNLAHLSLALPAPLTDEQIADIAQLEHLELAGLARLNVQAERALHVPTLATESATLQQRQPRPATGATNLRQEKPATKAQEPTEVAEEEPAANIFRARTKADEIKSGGYHPHKAHSDTETEKELSWGWAKTHSGSRGLYKEQGKLSRRLAELKQQVQSLEAQEC